MDEKIKLRNILVEKYDYKQSQVDGIVEKIMNFSPEVKKDFDLWIETGKISDLSVSGYTIKKIIETVQMKIVSAYITLDWMKKDENAAKAALEYYMENK